MDRSDVMELIDLVTRNLTREDQSTLSIGVVDLDGFTIHCIDSKTQHAVNR